MFEKTQALVERYEELNRLLSSPEVVTNPDLLRAYAQEQAELGETVRTYEHYRNVERELADAQALAETEEDPEMLALIREETALLENEVLTTAEKLKLLLVPKDPRDGKSVIVEVRAGAGGDEAGLFAADLYRMYTLYAMANGWKTEVISSNETGIGGYKEIVFEVRGKGAYSRLKFESGVHRVQRVPDTEASGRIHTSTATVAVLPEADELDVTLDENDIRIDIYRAGGHGGQGVNTTDSAVRLTHLPTGIVVQCQNERSQLQNKLRAMEVLRARVYDLEYSRTFGERDEARRQQVGTGERSEKIRTYNFPQNRVTDHRIGMSIYRLESVLAGELDAFIDELALQEQAERLELAQEA
ncbi:MAG: peptide chain release factor 1 [Chloroflexi bacterium]|jgi:peptide chain release factor 1|nr:peptide chain release factor 1 [Chloroflexota bacterium]